MVQSRELWIPIPWSTILHEGLLAGNGLHFTRIAKNFLGTGSAYLKDFKTGEGGRPIFRT